MYRISFQLYRLFILRKKPHLYSNTGTDANADANADAEKPMPRFPNGLKQVKTINGRVLTPTTGY